MNAILTVPIAALTAFVTVAMCVQWDAAPVEDGVAAYRVEHAGLDGTFTNVAEVAVPSVQACLTLPLGQHLFRVTAVTTNGTTSVPSLLATTLTLEVNSR